MITKQEFINKSNNIHNYKYDYSLVNYINNTTKVIIVCSKHGEFKQIPKNHKKGVGCPKCSPTYKYTTYEFIKTSNYIHNNFYDYSITNYINSHKKIKIICPEHGIFEQKPYKHIQQQGCPKCQKNYKKNNKTFIKISNSIHNYKYDYSLVNYINSTSNVKIICSKHGVFEQIPKSHMKGHGCPLCNESKGEKKVRNILEKYNIDYVPQKSFKNCKYINNLLFDFYLPDYNTCIEYDGIQHYKINDFFGGQKEYDKIKVRDNIKNNYCKENNIKLIRIKYNEDVIIKIKSIINDTYKYN